MADEQTRPPTAAENLAAAIVDMINAQHVHYANRDKVQLARFDKLVRAIEAALTRRE
jgi:hypothetical protein